MNSETTIAERIATPVHERIRNFRACEWLQGITGNRWELKGDVFTASSEGDGINPKEPIKLGNNMILQKTKSGKILNGLFAQQLTPHTAPVDGKFVYTLPARFVFDAMGKNSGVGR